MTVRIKLPHQLAEIAKTPSVDVKARSVKEAILEMERKHPALTLRVRDEQGEVRKHIAIFVNQEEIRLLQGLSTPLLGDEDLYILPAVSGG